jgi:hypothetical protein
MLLPLLLTVLLAGDGRAASRADWSAPGGGASGSGRSEARGLRGPVEERWTLSPGGVVEGEPLAVDGAVVVAVRESARSRALHVVDQATGEPLCSPTQLSSAVPLEPVANGRTLVVRGSANGVEAWQLGGRRLWRRWQFGAAGAVSGHTLAGDLVLVAGDGGLEAIAIGEREARWRVEGRFRGRPVTDGDTVWALAYDDAGGLQLVEVDLDAGPSHGRFALGSDPEGVPRVTDAAALAFEDRQLLVLLPRPADLGERTASGLWITRTTDPARPYVQRGLDLAAPATASSAGWLLQLDGEPPLLGALDTSSGRLGRLATATNHAAFLGLPATACGDVAYLGARAFELSTGSILWERDIPTDRRSIPAGELLLVVEGGARVVALGARGSSRDRAYRSRELARTGRLPRGVAVLRDGTVERGEVILGEDALVLPRSGSTPPRRVLHVEDERGRLLFAASPREGARGVRLLVEAELADGYADLARKAVDSVGAETVRRLLVEARRLGADEGQLAHVERALEARRTELGSTRFEAHLAAREAELLERSAEVVWARVLALPDDVPPELLYGLLELMLEVALADPRPGEVVRALLPPRSVPRRGLDTREWLEFLRHSRRVSVRAAASAQDGPLARARAGWRADLVGFESPGLVVISPLDRPGALARCLATGEVVTRALESFFEGAVQPAPGKLVLHVHPDRRGYLATRGGRVSPVLAHSAGHYSPDERLSRIWIPEGSDGFDRALDTLVHELTHHWIDTRRRRGDGAAGSGERPGFWIVEGIATMFEEFHYEPLSGTWTSLDPDAHSLDLVANAPAGALLEWDAFFRLNLERFEALSPTETIDVPLSRALGRRGRVSRLSLFYHQAAAVCHFLHDGDGGRHRAALREYVLAWYGGRTRELDVQRAFGMTPDELGARALAWARAISEP